MDLLRNARCFAPAPLKTIELVSAELEVPLSGDLQRLYLITNGFESSGEFLDIVLWPIEDLLINNTAYDVNKYFPGLILIGSDTTGQALGYVVDNSGLQYIEVSFIGFEKRFSKQFSGTFFDFIRWLDECRRKASS